jgi:putative SOS response-associated peptidase YedK
MCYKVSTPTKDELEEYLAPSGYEVAEFQHYFHADGFTRPYLPVLSNDSKTVQPARWKLIPYWVKTEEEASKYANTLNAKSEELFEKASYKSYIQKNRCLLWVEGFFEPNHPSPKVTVPYYIKSIDKKPLALGSLYADWVNKDTGEVTRTFSIITTPSNKLLTEIHNEGQRMPFIVTPDNWEKWLSPISKEEIITMMQPLPEGTLHGYPVSGLVYKKGINTNVPETQEEFRASLF